MDVNDNIDEPRDAEYSKSTYSKKLEQRRTAIRQCIDEFETTADPFELGRALAYVTGDLLTITSTVGEAIIEHFHGDAATVETLKNVKVPMDDFIKLTRQIDRYDNLLLRNEEIRLKAKSAEISDRRGPHLGRGGIRPPGRF